MKNSGSILIIFVLILCMSLSGCICTKGALGSSCGVSTDCCSGTCEGGRCCADENYGCDEQEDCCEGLVYSEATHHCMEPEAACTAGGCTWITESAVAGGGRCDCPTGGGVVVPPRTCRECETNATCSIANYRYRLIAHSTECMYDCPEPTISTFWASSDARATECVRGMMRSLGCVNFPDPESGGMVCIAERMPL
jgi:hypothetical protein